jgi:hypothetical protein
MAINTEEESNVQVKDKKIIPVFLFMALSLLLAILPEKIGVEGLYGIIYVMVIKILVFFVQYVLLKSFVDDYYLALGK